MTNNNNNRFPLTGLSLLGLVIMASGLWWAFGGETSPARVILLEAPLLGFSGGAYFLHQLPIITSTKKIGRRLIVAVTPLLATSTMSTLQFLATPETSRFFTLSRINGVILAVAGLSLMIWASVRFIKIGQGKVLPHFWPKIFE